MDTFKKRLANLLTVKSLVTLILTGVFAFLAVTQQIAQDFMTVYAFYFGTQSQRIADATEAEKTGTPATVNYYYRPPDGETAAVAGTEVTADGEEAKA
mgnify:CR=1 FL=1